MLNPIPATFKSLLVSLRDCYCFVAPVDAHPLLVLTSNLPEPIMHDSDEVWFGFVEPFFDRNENVVFLVKLELHNTHAYCIVSVLEWGKGRQEIIPSGIDLHNAI